ncbi:hypothetical protein NL676_031868 [Syzygium grande]|nr:hypothetical protein NL676_031868 [Syzygium grande]
MTPKVDPFLKRPNSQKNLKLHTSLQIEGCRPSLATHLWPARVVGLRAAQARVAGLRAGPGKGHRSFPTAVAASTSEGLATP